MPQEADNLTPGELNKPDETIESWAQVCSTQGEQSVEKEVVASRINRRIQPRCKACWRPS
jgi:hypothetical protein